MSRCNRYVRIPGKTPRRPPVVVEAVGIVQIDDDKVRLIPVHDFDGLGGRACREDRGSPVAESGFGPARDGRPVLDYDA
ncbi:MULTISPECIES: hypothetical protein [unclassified Rhizobium]|uniref:hypothetical protein n=1 Tax=unclassified Rhizobium TaxID=2613769 RepID=UPI00117B933B|nr:MULTISPECIES: hypothetical protein [unclassified Rhizobium]MDF0664168.1 hypothetical protein [Rhizobium sp. BC49]